MGEQIALTRKDFVSDQEVKWCPGCGDYGVLAAIQKTMPTIGVPKEKIVFISGIGCSSRFPYYMNTYGFHTIHGRAPAIATGVKLANPELSVWVITGDGDALSIGGNHFIHAIRRNHDIKIVLFNNEIYGLTKGQASPTSQVGSVTKSTPYGSIDNPFNPVALALGAEATFVARTYDKNQSHMSDVFSKAAAHKGIAFIEVLQNCVIFNDGAHDPVIGKEVRDESIIAIENGQPLLFGANKDKGIIIDGANPQVVNVADVGVDKLHVHNSGKLTSDYAYLLARMKLPNFPVPMGVFRDVDKPVYHQEYYAQTKKVKEQKGEGDLKKLLYSGETWTVS